MTTKTANNFIKFLNEITPSTIVEQHNLLHKVVTQSAEIAFCIFDQMHINKPLLLLIEYTYNLAFFDKFIYPIIVSDKNKYSFYELHAQTEKIKDTLSEYLSRKETIVVRDKRYFFDLFKVTVIFAHNKQDLVNELVAESCWIKNKLDESNFKQILGSKKKQRRILSTLKDSTQRQLFHYGIRYKNILKEINNLKYISQAIESHRDHSFYLVTVPGLTADNFNEYTRLERDNFQPPDFTNLEYDTPNSMAIEKREVIFTKQDLFIVNTVVSTNCNIMTYILSRNKGSLINYMTQVINKMGMLPLRRDICLWYDHLYIFCSDFFRTSSIFKYDCIVNYSNNFRNYFNFENEIYFKNSLGIRIYTHYDKFYLKGPRIQISFYVKAYVNRLQ